MFITLACPECYRVGYEGYPCPAFKAPITTAPGAVVRCFQGHKLVLVFQASGWALLFERAMRRVADNEPRDAAIDGYTAFEMYLAEVPVRARYDREAGASPRELRKQLRGATHTTERAVGAARAAVSLVSGKPPPKWDEKKTTNIRNSAVHAGEYPTILQAEGLCVEVARVIVEFEAFLDVPLAADRAPFHKAVWLEESQALQAANPDASATFVSTGAIFDWSTPPEQRDVAARIAEYRAHPARPHD